MENSDLVLLLLRLAWMGDLMDEAQDDIRVAVAVRRASP
jgi:hypothetical protein